MIDSSLTRELIQAGFRMSLVGGKLRVEPASKLSDGLRKRISSHKLEIIADSRTIGAGRCATLPERHH